MNPRSRSPLPRRLAAFRAAALGLVVLFGLSACLTRSDTTPYRTLGWEKHRLFNAARPYDKLLVEIDAVAGSEPDAAELADLKAFLEQFTRKPRGITVKLIAPAKARGRAADSLALEYLNGPPDGKSERGHVVIRYKDVDPVRSIPVVTIHGMPPSESLGSRHDLLGIANGSSRAPGA